MEPSERKVVALERGPDVKCHENTESASHLLLRKPQFGLQFCTVTMRNLNMSDFVNILKEVEKSVIMRPNI